MLCRIIYLLSASQARGTARRASPTENVRLKAEVLDADGRVVEEAFIVALGATGLSHRVSVLSFDADADPGSRT